MGVVRTMQEQLSRTTQDAKVECTREYMNILSRNPTQYRAAIGLFISLLYVAEFLGPRHIGLDKGGRIPHKTILPVTERQAGLD